MHGQHQIEDLRIIIEHLFKMRREPVLIGGIAGIAAAQMIIDAALRHGGQRFDHHFGKRGIAGPQIAAPDIFQHINLREFRGGAETAMHRIGFLRIARGDAVQHLDRQLRPLPVIAFIELFQR